MSEARTERLEEDIRDIRAALARLEPLIIRIDERLTTELPHLATKAELEKKPGRGELWGAIAAMVGAQAVIAAVLAAILTWAPPARGAEAFAPGSFDWDRYHARQDACREADRIAQGATCANQPNRAGGKAGKRLTQHRSFRLRYDISIRQLKPGNDCHLRSYNRTASEPRVPWWRRWFN